MPLCPLKNWKPASNFPFDLLEGFDLVNPSNLKLSTLTDCLATRIIDTGQGPGNVQLLALR